MNSVVRFVLFPGTRGPGYASPLDALNNGPREELLYVVCVQPDPTKQDYLSTVDVDPKSPTYCQVSLVLLPPFKRLAVVGQRRSTSLRLVTDFLGLFKHEFVWNILVLHL